MRRLRRTTRRSRSGLLPGSAGRVAAGIVVAGMVAWVALAASPAQAHAVLVSMIPGDGSTVTRAPARVTLVFDEDIRTPSKVVVSGPSGDRVDHGTTSIVDNRVSVGVRVRPRPADVGRYVVGWRVVSADGHVVTGQRDFAFRPHGVNAAAAPANPHAASTPSGPPVWWFVVGVVAVGVLLFLLLRPRRAHR